MQANAGELGDARSASSHARAASSDARRKLSTARSVEPPGPAGLSGLSGPALPATPAGPPGLRIRRAVPEDARALSEVFVAAWRHGYAGILAPAVLDRLEVAATAEWLAPSITAEATTTSVAVAATEAPEVSAAPPAVAVAVAAAAAKAAPVARATAGSPSAFCRYGEDPDEPGTGHVFSLYVAPQAQGHGLARALLATALAELAGAGYPSTSLWVFAENERARRLYGGFGFVPDGTERTEQAYGAPEIRMVRPLAASPRPAIARPEPARRASPESARRASSWR